MIPNVRFMLVSEDRSSQNVEYLASVLQWRFGIFHDASQVFQDLPLRIERLVDGGIDRSATNIPAPSDASFGEVAFERLCEHVRWLHQGTWDSRVGAGQRD